MAPAGVVQWIEHQTEKQRVASSIPRQGTCLGCRPHPQLGAHKRQPHIDVSLSLSPSLPLFLKINKSLKKKSVRAMNYFNYLCSIFSKEKNFNKLLCGWLWQAESAGVAEDENKCTQTPIALWRKRDGTGTLFKMTVLRPLLSRGECLNPCLDRLLFIFSGLISKKDLLSIT